MLFKDTVKKMKRKAIDWGRSCNIYATILNSVNVPRLPLDTTQHTEPRSLLLRAPRDQTRKELV